MWIVWGRGEIIQSCGGETWRKKTTWDGRPEVKWEVNVRIDLEEIVLEDVEWIDLAWDRDSWVAFMKAEMNLRIA